MKKMRRKWRRYMAWMLTVIMLMNTMIPAYAEVSQGLQQMTGQSNTVSEPDDSVGQAASSSNADEDTADEPVESSPSNATEDDDIPDEDVEPVAVEADGSDSTGTITEFIRFHNGDADQSFYLEEGDYSLVVDVTTQLEYRYGYEFKWVITDTEGNEIEQDDANPIMLISGYDAEWGEDGYSDDAYVFNESMSGEKVKRTFYLTPQLAGTYKVAFQYVPNATSEETITISSTTSMEIKIVEEITEKVEITKAVGLDDAGTMIAGDYLDLTVVTNVDFRRYDGFVWEIRRTDVTDNEAGPVVWEWNGSKVRWVRDSNNEYSSQTPVEVEMLAGKHKMSSTESGQDITRKYRLTMQEPGDYQFRFKMNRWKMEDPLMSSERIYAEVTEGTPVVENIRINGGGVTMFAGEKDGNLVNETAKLRADLKVDPNTFKDFGWQVERVAEDGTRTPADGTELEIWWEDDSYQPGMVETSRDFYIKANTPGSYKVTLEKINTDSSASALKSKSFDIWVVEPYEVDDSIVLLDEYEEPLTVVELEAGERVDIIAQTVTSWDRFDSFFWKVKEVGTDKSWNMSEDEITQDGIWTQVDGQWVWTESDYIEWEDAPLLIMDASDDEMGYDMDEKDDLIVKNRPFTIEAQKAGTYQIDFRMKYYRLVEWNETDNKYTGKRLRSEPFDLVITGDASASEEYVDITQANFPLHFAVGETAQYTINSCLDPDTYTDLEWVIKETVGTEPDDSTDPTWTVYSDGSASDSGLPIEITPADDNSYTKPELFEQEQRIFNFTAVEEGNYRIQIKKAGEEPVHSNWLQVSVTTAKTDSIKIVDGDGNLLKNLSLSKDQTVMVAVETNTDWNRFDGFFWTVKYDGGSDRFNENSSAEDVPLKIEVAEAPEGAGGGYGYNMNNDISGNTVKRYFNITALEDGTYDLRFRMGLWKIIEKDENGKWEDAVAKSNNLQVTVGESDGGETIRIDTGKDTDGSDFPMHLASDEIAQYVVKTKLSPDTFNGFEWVIVQDGDTPQEWRISSANPTEMNDSPIHITAVGNAYATPGSFEEENRTFNFRAYEPGSYRIQLRKAGYEEGEAAQSQWFMVTYRDYPVEHLRTFYSDGQELHNIGLLKGETVTIRVDSAYGFDWYRFDGFFWNVEEFLDNSGQSWTINKKNPTGANGDAPIMIEAVGNAYDMSKDQPDVVREFRVTARETGTYYLTFHMNLWKQIEVKDDGSIGQPYISSGIVTVTAEESAKEWIEIENDLDGETELPMHLVVGETAQYRVNMKLHPNLFKGLEWVIVNRDDPSKEWKIASDDLTEMAGAPLYIRSGYEGVYDAPDTFLEENYLFDFQAVAAGNYKIQLRKAGSTEDEAAASQWMMVDIAETSTDEFHLIDAKGTDLTNLYISEGETVTIRVESKADWYRFDKFYWVFKTVGSERGYIIDEAWPAGKFGDTALRIEAVGDAYDMTKEQSGKTVIREFQATASKSGTYDLYFAMTLRKQSGSSNPSNTVQVSISASEFSVTPSTDSVYVGGSTTGSIYADGLTMDPENIDWQVTSEDGGSALITIISGTEFKIEGKNAGTVQIVATYNLEDGTTMTSNTCIVKVHEAPTLTVTPEKISRPAGSDAFNVTAVLVDNSRTVEEIYWENTYSASNGNVRIDTVTSEGFTLIVPVIPVTAGNSVVTVEQNVPGYGIVTDTCEIEVYEAPKLTTTISGQSLYEGSQKDISDLITNLNKDRDTVQVTSSAPAVVNAAMNAAGTGVILEALGAGTAQVTVTLNTPYMESQSVTFDVEVKGEPNISISAASAALMAGETKDLTVTLPEELSDADIVWQFENANAVTLQVSDDKKTAILTARNVMETETANVKVTVKKEGFADKTATCVVTVYPKPTLSLTTSADPVTMCGNSVTATITLNDASGKANINNVTLTASEENGKVQLSRGTEEGQSVIYTLTAEKAGEVTLTATLSGIDGIAPITVTKNITVARGQAELTMTGTMRLFAGKTETLQVTIPAPYDSYESVTWASDNEHVAVVEGDGLQATVTAVGAGSAKITATVVSEQFQAAPVTCDVTVDAIPTLSITTSAETVVIGKESITATIALNDTSGKADISNVTLTANDINGKVEIVKATAADQAGVYTINGVKAGEVTLTATLNGIDGITPITVTKNITVARGQAELTMTGTMRLFAGKTETLQVTIPAPYDSYESVTWTSNNEAVAAVEGNGLQATVTAVAAGNAQITATVVSDQFQAEPVVCDVTVDAVPAFTLSADKGGVVYEGDQLTVSAALTAGSADLTKLTWEQNSTDGGKVSIEHNADGRYLVTGMTAGTVTLKASLTVDGLDAPVTAECTIHVVEHEKIEIVNDKDEDGETELPMHLVVGETARYDVATKLHPSHFNGFDWVIVNRDTAQEWKISSAKPTEMNGSPIHITEVISSYEPPISFEEAYRMFDFQATAVGNYKIQLRKAGCEEGEAAQSQWMMVDIAATRTDEFRVIDAEGADLTDLQILEGETVVVRVESKADWYRFLGYCWFVGAENSSYKITKYYPDGIHGGGSPLRIVGVDNAFDLTKDQSGKTVTREFQVTALETGSYDLTFAMELRQQITLENSTDFWITSNTVPVTVAQSEFIVALEADPVYAGGSTTGSLYVKNFTIDDPTKIEWSITSEDGGSLDITAIDSTSFGIAGKTAGTVQISASYALESGITATSSTCTVNVLEAPTMTITPDKISVPAGGAAFEMTVVFADRGQTEDEVYWKNGLYTDNENVIMNWVSGDDFTFVESVTPVTVGTTIVTAEQDVPGYGIVKDTCEIEIYAAPKLASAISGQNLYVKNQKDLSDLITNLDKERDTVQVTSSAPAVVKAELNEAGTGLILEALSVGTSQVTVVLDSPYLDTQSVTFEVKIENEPVIDISSTNMELFAGKTNDLTVTLPIELEGAEIVWTSANTGAVTVQTSENSSTATLTAQNVTKTETVEVTVTVKKAGITDKTATCVVTVYPMPTLSLTTSADKTQVYGDAIKATLTLTGASAKVDINDARLTFSDTDGSVKYYKGAAADQTVVYTFYGWKAGEVTLTASLSSIDGMDPITVTKTITIERGLTSITMDGSMHLYTSKSGTLEAMIANAYDELESVTWTSDTPGVATVEGDGLQATVTAVGAGSAKITVTVVSAHFETVSATCDVTVEETPAFTLSTDKKGIVYEGDSLMVTSTLTAGTADLTKLTWTQSSTNGGSVSVEHVAEGRYRVTGIAAGDVRLTASLTVDGLDTPVTAPCDVSVVKRETIKINTGKDTDGTTDLPMHLVTNETARYDVKTTLRADLFEGFDWVIVNRNDETQEWKISSEDPNAMNGAPIHITAVGDAYAVPGSFKEETRTFDFQAKTPGSYKIQLRKAGYEDGEMAQSQWFIATVAENRTDVIRVVDPDGANLSSLPIQEGNTVTVRVNSNVDWYRFDGFVWNVQDDSIDKDWNIIKEKPTGEDGNSPLKIEAVGTAFDLTKDQSVKDVTREFKVTALKSGTYDLSFRMKLWKQVELRGDGTTRKARIESNKVDVTVTQPEFAAALAANQVYSGKSTTLSVNVTSGSVDPNKIYWTTTSGDNAAVKIEKTGDYNYKVTGTINGTVQLTASYALATGTIVKSNVCEITVTPAPKLTVAPKMISYPAGSAAFNVKVSAVNTAINPANLNVSANNGSVQIGTVTMDGADAVIPVTPVAAGSSVITVTLNVPGYDPITATCDVTVLAPPEEGKVTISASTEIKNDAVDVETKAKEEISKALESKDVKDVLEAADEKVTEAQKAAIKSSIEEQISEQTKQHSQKVEESVAKFAELQEEFSISTDAVKEEVAAESVITLKMEVTDVEVKTKVADVDVEDEDNPSVTVESEITKVTMEISLVDEAGNNAVKEGNTRTIYIPIAVPDGVSPEAVEVKIIHNGVPMENAKIQTKDGIRYFVVETTSFSPFEFEFVVPKQEEKPQEPLKKPTYSGGGGGGSNSKPKKEQTITIDAVKGRVDKVTGIVTGPNNTKQSGYSSWYLQADGTWKFMYANGTMAAGRVLTDAAGNAYEQPHWELINGAWYAFNSSGTTVNGWIFDVSLGGWFYIDINVGMKTGWIEVGGKWYYLNPVSDGYKGRMAYSTITPDGYYVDASGAWDGKAKVN